MATSAGIQCALDPILCQCLRGLCGKVYGGCMCKIGLEKPLRHVVPSHVYVVASSFSLASCSVV